MQCRRKEGGREKKDSWVSQGMGEGVKEGEKGEERREKGGRTRALEGPEGCKGEADGASIALLVTKGLRNGVSVAVATGEERREGRRKGMAVSKWSTMSLESRGYTPPKDEDQGSASAIGLPPFLPPSPSLWSYLKTGVGYRSKYMQALMG